MVPWDTRHQLTIPASKLGLLKAHDERTQFVTSLMDRFFTLYGMKLNREFEFNDPAAVWLPLFAPQQFSERRVEVVTSADGFGAVVELAEGPPIMLHSCRPEDTHTIINELLVKLDLV